MPPDLAATGCPVLELFNKDLQFSTYIQQSLKNPSGRNQVEIHLLRGDDKRIILAGSSVLESDKKNPKQLIFNLNDITALKKLESEIRQSQRLADLGIMASGMAHEIRNPLSAIKTYVALLPEKVKKPGFMEKFQRTVPREINRLNTLIEELLELSKPPKYNFIPTDLGHLLMQSIELVETNFKNKGIGCQWDIPKEMPQLMADADQLQKVFINLMKNGAQAMPNGGMINIHVSIKKTEIKIDFRDGGHGFSPDLAENIFNPFFTTKTKGTGLGLAITHKVLSEHGGQIVAKSKKGEGSCFSVRLPRMMD